MVFIHFPPVYISLLVMYLMLAHTYTVSVKRLDILFREWEGVFKRLTGTVFLSLIHFMFVFTF